MLQEQNIKGSFNLTRSTPNYCPSIEPPRRLEERNGTQKGRLLLRRVFEEDEQPDA